MHWLLTISQQTSWQIISKVITSLSTLLILSLITRTYDTTGTGIYTLVLTYLSFFYIACDFGINAYLLPHLVKESSNEVFQKLLGLRLLLGVSLMLISIMLLPFMPFSSAEFVKATIIGSITILGYALFLTFSAVYQARLRFDLVTKAMLISTPVTFGIIYLVTYFNWSIIHTFWGHIGGWIVFCSVSLFFIKKFYRSIMPKLDLRFTQTTLTTIWPVSLTLLLNTLYFRADAFMLTSIKSFAEVGVYNLAYQLFQSALVLPAFITNSYYPLMLKNLSDNRDSFLRNLIQVALIMLGISLIGIVITWITAPWVISWFGNESFSGAIHSLRILSLGFPAFFLSSILMWTLISLKRYKSVLAVYVTGLIVNLILNWWYIPSYSYIASSWITGISEYLILILQLCILVPLLRKKTI